MNGKILLDTANPTAIGLIIPHTISNDQDPNTQKKIGNIFVTHLQRGNVKNMLRITPHVQNVIHPHLL